MAYKRPRVKQNQYNKIIPLDSSNPDELRHYNELMASHEAYMKECDEIDAYWENNPLSKIGKEAREVYNNAKNRWSQFETAHPMAATGLKIGACVAGAALIIGAVKSLADVIDDDDSGSHDYLNVAADSDDNVMQSRAGDDVEYNIENISNDTANDDIQPVMDEHGVYWLKGESQTFDIMYKEGNGNEKVLAENVGIDNEDIEVDNGNIIFIDHDVYLINKDAKELKKIISEQDMSYIAQAKICDDNIAYGVLDLNTYESTLYINDLTGKNPQIVDKGDIGGLTLSSNNVVYHKNFEDGTSQGKIYNLQTQEITNLTTMSYIKDLNIKEGKIAFVGSENGENWAVYLIDDINDLDSFEKIKNVESDDIDITLSHAKCVIHERNGVSTVFDLQTKEKIDFSKTGRREFYSFEDKLLYSESENTSIDPDSEVYLTDLSVKEPIEPVNTAPKILTTGGEINGKGIEILVDDAEGDPVDISVSTPGYTLKDGKELIYTNEYPEENLTELVSVKATDSKGAYTEKSLEVTVIGTGKEPIINPNPDPNPDPVDPVPNGNSTGSGAGFWSKYMIPIIGGAAATVTATVGGIAGVIGYKRHKKNKGKKNGRKPTAVYPSDSISRREVPAPYAAQNVQKAAEA